MAFAPPEVPLQGAILEESRPTLAFAASSSVFQGLMPDSQAWLRTDAPEAFICHPGPIFLL